MLRFFYVAVGGALGAMLRYIVSGWSHRIFPNILPWGTLIVNVSGSLIIGILWAVFEGTIVSQNTRLLLLVGVLGSYTTFSSFSLESLNLFRDSEYGFFFLNILSNLVLGLGCVFAGYVFTRYILNIIK
ncbi:MAG: fluoride efflux transporter CrcB [Candidatus Aureabacteria bacterium]|nr:fluoride efflux transporter CrcB [Candidatus Auribacterota bacterium]